MSANPDPDPAELPLAERARLTYRWDLVRGAGAGILEGMWTTLGLLVAVRVFAAPELAKGILAAAINLGMLLAPFSLWFFARRGGRVGPLCAALLGGSALALVAASLAPSSGWFVAAALVSATLSAQQIPLVVTIYAANYPTRERGWRYSRSAVVGGVAGIAFSVLSGRLLDADLSWWRAVFGGLAGVALAVAFAFSRMPTPRLDAAAAASPWRGLRYAVEDRLFGRLLAGWMVMGLGNLMCLPIRVDYLADPVHGLHATNAQVTLLLVAIPAAARLLSTRAWGWVFDRVNFIVLRSLVNLLFLLAIVLFFSTANLVVIGCAGVAYGLANAGGSIAWQLWVTKVAPPGLVPAYMGVHSLLTGVRGVIAPFLAYALLAHLPAVAVAWIGAAILAASFVVFLPARGAVDARATQAG